MTVAVDGADFATWSVSMAQGLSGIDLHRMHLATRHVATDRDNLLITLDPRQADGNAPSYS